MRLEIPIAGRTARSPTRNQAELSPSREDRDEQSEGRAKVTADTAFLPEPDCGKIGTSGARIEVYELQAGQEE